MSWRTALILVGVLSLISGLMHLIWADQATRWYARQSRKRLGRLVIRDAENKRVTISIGVVQVTAAAFAFVVVALGRT